MADTNDPKSNQKTEANKALSTAPELAGAPSEEPAKPMQPEPENTDEVDEEVDPETDQAVDDIMKKEGDDALKSLDEKAVVMKTGRLERFKNGWVGWWSSPGKRWSTIGVIAVVLAVTGVWPVARYTALGFVMKSSVTVRAVDSKTGAPISGATVELSNKTAETQADGKAVLHVNLGSGKLKVSKKYYTGYSRNELVGLGGNSFKASLVATGRQVQVKVVNKLTGKPLANVEVNAQGAKAKTNASGLATMVIGSSVETQAANVTLSGYNTTKASIAASGDLAKNTFGITPSGKLYFLSNLSGKIDVVKTNLDGSDRQTVLAGTGNEDRSTTSLLASRDWKYLALLSKRSSNNASVYLIDTTNGDKLTTIDEGDATFSLVGWSGDRFVYTVFRNGVANWQAGQEALKSFDPATGRTLLLDQTQASGTSSTSFGKQTFGAVYLIGSRVLYTKNWGGSGWSGTDIKQPELDAIGSDGSGHSIIKAFSINGYTNPVNYGYLNIDVRLYEPDELYLYCPDCDAGSQFYDYSNGKVTSSANLTSDKFYQSAYPTYLLSPSGGSTFWADQRDGKNTLFTGDEDAKNQKQIASLSDYNTYGWYTDNYLLVSKNSSELYIMPASGGTPFKITDYYKPAINYQGYGGGYGGL